MAGGDRVLLRNTESQNRSRGFIFAFSCWESSGFASCFASAAFASCSHTTDSIQGIPRNSSSSRSGFVGVFGAAAFFLETSTRNFKRKLEAETCSWHARWSVKFTWPAHRETQQQTTKRLRRPEACLVCIGTSLAKGSVTLPSSEGANPKLIHENEGLEAGECGVAIAVISDAHQESRTPSSLLSLRPPVVDSIKVASGTAAHKRRDRSTADASTPWPSLPLPAGHSCWAFGWVPN